MCISVFQSVLADVQPTAFLNSYRLTRPFNGTSALDLSSDKHSGCPDCGSKPRAGRWGQTEVYTCKNRPTLSHK